MQLNVYLNFKGECQEAFQFYEQSLGGKIESMMPYAGSPAEKHIPEEWKQKIVHARLVNGGAVLMGCDVPPDRYKPPVGYSINIGVDSEEEAERIYAALSQGATITMPLQATFWAIQFAMLTDRYGVPWMINYEEKK